MRIKEISGESCLSTKFAKHLAKHELIGLEVEVLSSKCKTHLGIKGKVVDETKNMLLIEKERQTVKIPKKGTKLRFFFDGKAEELNGDRILYRPEDRIKRAR
ncbi:MAG: ribonuclease P protein subunit [Candidatus Thermoplasmatota archaeon]